MQGGGVFWHPYKGMLLFEREWVKEMDSCTARK